MAKGSLSNYRKQRRNANKHTPAGLAALDDSIRGDGWIGAMTVAADGETFDGSARLERVTDIMPDAEPIVVESDGTRPIIVKRTDIPNTDDPRAKRLGVVANISARIDYDPDAEILASIAKEDDIVKRLAEQDDKSLQAILAADKKNGGGGDDDPPVDKAEELQAKWKVQVGDIWQLADGHFVICGDCREAETWRRVMVAAGADKVPLVVTSPPYAVGKEYEANTSFAEHIVLLEAIADRCIENVIPGGFVFTNFGEIAPQSHAGPLTGSDRQCIYLISKDYWRIFHDERHCDLYAQRIWYKPFNRLQQPFWSYHTSIPHHQEWEHIWTWRTPGGNGDKCNDWDISVHAIWDTRKESTDDRPLTRHVAAFPVGIPERAIRAHSSSGDMIADPFAGSGTTGIAAMREGRRAALIEILPKYVAVILERYAMSFGCEPHRVGDG